MFQHILVPLDGSQRSEQALALAAHIARVHHSSILLLQSIEILSIYSMETVGMMEHIQQLEEQGAEKYLHNLEKSPLLDQIPVTTQVYQGNASSAILDAVSHHAIDLVVLCSHGYTGLKQWVLGSVAHKIARSCPVPVLIQRDEYPLPFGGEPEGEHQLRVCIALDGSPEAEAVIEPAISIAVACAPAQCAEIHLLRILPPLNQSDEDLFKEIYHLDLQATIHEQAQAYLRTVVKYLEPMVKSYAGIKLMSSLRSSTDVAQEIIQYAEKSSHWPSFQLLAMTTHGHSPLDRWVFGSTAERILNRTRLPLLIVRPA
ncbi:universal stress protein [Tengunoibacter tsumagoiensis]|uniref:Universal stress protein UspA n=1 Tax=Tengunoibacter tsumagoiensis TaxID=2014871 RepID=A0A402A728_9CHLR|nr:universal stress protein [Tengunoibacter tsumagoiensis]GCE14836.1 universal stress protein UspA [Tengunoibacter tsumagoiensis]